MKRARAIDPTAAAPSQSTVRDILGGAATSHLPAPSAVFDSVLARLLPPPGPRKADAEGSKGGKKGAKRGEKAAAEEEKEGAAEMEVDTTPAVASEGAGSSAIGALPAAGIRKDLLGMLVEAFRGGNGGGGAETAVVTANGPASGGATPSLNGPAAVGESGGRSGSRRRSTGSASGSASKKKK